jgi:hypothetical protein
MARIALVFYHDEWRSFRKKFFFRTPLVLIFILYVIVVGNNLQQSQNTSAIEATLAGFVQGFSAITGSQVLQSTSDEGDVDQDPQAKESGVIDPFYNISSDGANLWDTSGKIPYWMKHYFNWHKQARKQLTESNWKSQRFLIMQCLAGAQYPQPCGGSADRLKTLPWALRTAYRSRRILLIYWTKPAKLEEFLVPPKGGIDWRVPAFMAEKVTILVFLPFIHIAFLTAGRPF